MDARRENKILDEVGSRLALARKDKQMSQEELAAKTGLDRVAIGYIEQGRRRPTLTTIIRLSRGLGVSLEKLFTGL